MFRIGQHSALTLTLHRQLNVMFAFVRPIPQHTGVVSRIVHRCRSRVNRLVLLLRFDDERRGVRRPRTRLAVLEPVSTKKKTKIYIMH